MTTRTTCDASSNKVETRTGKGDTSPDWALEDRGIPWTCVACGQAIVEPGQETAPRRRFLVRFPANWDELMDKAGYRPLKEFVIQ